MPNHVHPIAVPRWEDGLRRASGEAHRRYTRRINFREKWRAYLGQGRFASFVMHQLHLLAAARYVERNPLRTGLVADAAGVAVEQRKGAPLGPRPPPGASHPDAGVDRRLAWLSRRRDPRRGNASLAQPWPHRPPA